VKVVVRGTTYETDVTRWSPRTVRGEQFFTKTLEPGVIAVITREYAAQYGVHVDRAVVIDATLALPSVMGGSWTPTYQAAPVPPVKSRRKPAKPKLSDFAGFDLAVQLRREAERLMSDQLDMQERMRREFIRKFTTSKNRKTP
jgi:hypothetical protein